MQDIWMIGIVAFAVPLLMIGAISFGLRFFVALGAPPSRRAAWTVGLAYLITSAIIVFGAPDEIAYYGPLAALPGGLIAFWFWRSDFRRGWVENEAGLADGAVLANDDWRIGILQLLAVMVLVIGIVLLRAVRSGVFGSP
ncbi:hypothetical protein [Sphingosinicella terrae]|uniref:hypothetical protein n=1 Tax=Sphingosinicella terrae TaxID=2172047 RepID=UPI000E0E024B|nr:hypothetical protein [Sphingosinicella terrae]